jgi:hypothetical protein
MCERVYAKILRPPSHLVEIKSVDYSEAEKMTGVQVVREGDLIAVLHELPDVAERALGTIYNVPNKLSTSYVAKQEPRSSHSLPAPGEPQVPAPILLPVNRISILWLRRLKSILWNSAFATLRMRR